MSTQESTWRVKSVDYPRLWRGVIVGARLFHSSRQYFCGLRLRDCNIGPESISSLSLSLSAAAHY